MHTATMDTPSIFDTFFGFLGENWGKIAGTLGTAFSIVSGALLWLYRRFSKETGISAWTWFKSFVHAPIALAEMQKQLTFANGVSLDERFRSLENDHSFFRQWLTNETANRRMLLQNVKQAIFEFSPSGRCSWANAELLRICGVTIGQVLDRNWLNCIAIPDRDRVRDEWETCVNDGTDCRANFRLFNNTWVEFRAWCNKDAFGQVVGYTSEIVETSDPRVHATS